MSNMSGLTGNGQQCFEGDCAAGNCTMVVREEESVEVRLGKDSFEKKKKSCEFSQLRGGVIPKF